jgi:hypothetical protein
MEATLQPSVQRSIRIKITLIEAIELALLGSWVIYNVHIRIARAAGRMVDIGLWIIASALTGSYIFWAWTILDVNRYVMAKLFYRGKAPVEYAWSIRSKQIRNMWGQTQKAVRYQ